MPVIGAPSPALRVESASDLPCRAVLLLLQKGFDRSGVSDDLCLLRVRAPCPLEPPNLDPQEVDPFCALPNPRFSFAEGQAPVGEKGFSPRTDRLFEPFPSRGDGHEIVRLAHEASPVVPPLFPGWSLGVTVRRFSVEAAFHTVQGHVR